MTHEPRGGRFFFTDGVSYPDPDDPVLREALHLARYESRRLTRVEIYRILDAAEAYLHLAGRAGTTRDAVEQLRRVRRVVRGRRPVEKDSVRKEDEP